jgi:hypothetical protein
MESHYKNIDTINNSFYLIPNDYIPILINKSLFKNPDKAIKKVEDIQIPLYALDNCRKNCYIKKPPNAFIIFRSESFQKVKINNPNCSSREISIIIGKMWRQMTKECKLPYQLKAYEIMSKYRHLHPIHKYKKFLSNIKQREYLTTKEQYNDSNILSIKKLLFPNY